MADLSMMIDDTKFNYRVGLMIVRGSKVLVECNPDFDFVTLPGGRVHTLESSQEALKRELGEEMHIELDTSSLKMRALIENFFMLDNKKYHELYFLYLYHAEEDERFTENMVNFDSKASTYQWVEREKLGEVKLYIIYKIHKKNVI